MDIMLYSVLVIYSSRAVLKIICAIILSAIALLSVTDKANAQLQELAINPVSVEGAIPLIRDHPEMAAIIIRSSLTNLTFTSNMQIIEERTNPGAGEYTLIIEPVTQTIRVNASGFLAGRIPLRGLSARQVVYYSVEPASNESDNTLPVVFRITPSAADDKAVVLIDGERTDISRTVELEPGSYTVEIIADGYQSLNESIEISREQVFFEFSMQELQEQVVRIQTEPAGTIVFLDGIQEGVTDETGLLELFRLPGSYEISLFLNGYESVQNTITVKEEAVNEFMFEMEQNTAGIQLNVFPSNARVRINQQLIDLSESIELPEGTHRLEVSLDGYETYSEILVTERGQQIERSISLQANTGALQFRVNPSFAQVVLRDSNDRQIDQWTGIQRIESLRTGSYSLIVSADSYQSHEEEFEIYNDELTEITIRLEREAVTGEKVSQTEKLPLDLSSLPSRNTALASSFFMPGAGHIYSGRNRGYLYLLGGLASGGYILYSLKQEQTIESDYNSALQSFSNAATMTQSNQFRDDAVQHFNDWNDLVDRRTIALAALTGIYAIQLLDILITTPERGYRNSPKSGWQTSATASGIRFKYSFN